MKKITVKLGNTDKDIYITQISGHVENCTDFHKHPYTEVHYVYEGHLRFRVDDTEHVAMPGDMIALPGNVYHERLPSPEHTHWSVFQIDIPSPEVRLYRFSPTLTAECRMAAEKATGTDNFGDFALILSLLISRFFNSSDIRAEPIMDEAFIITEFLGMHYNTNPKLSDLAAQLFVSEKQAERLVKKHTGTTFKKALTAVRGTIAEHLIRTQGLPLNVVAKMVGYKSYNGFWKAHIKDTKEP